MRFLEDTGSSTGAAPGTDIGTINPGIEGTDAVDDQAIPEDSQGGTD